MSNKQNWRGVFAIPLVPWTDDDTIDEDVLRAEIDFMIDAGSPGVDGLDGAVEIRALSVVQATPSELRRFLELRELRQAF